MSEAMNSPNLKKEIFSKIAENKTEELRTLLTTNKIQIDFVDDNGMSALQHACYKGNKEMVQMILDQGADINFSKHEHNYTALHFAAISGNAEICHLLMSYGARATPINSVGRTAAQMAAFVGNHNCVAVINNFIPKADVDYYIKPQGLQKEPMLYPHLADSFHLFILQSNVHPVRVIMNFQKYSGLLENSSMVEKVLKSMSKKEMTQGSETNEVMGFKYHYLSYIVEDIVKFQKRQEEINLKNSTEGTKEKKLDLIEQFIKKLLKSNSDGILEYQESFLKDAIRDFNYRESAIFQQMVATLASSEPPSAISVVSAAINGQRGFDDSNKTCATCGEEKATKKCSKCKSVQYCDKECQKLHWFVHKKFCQESQTESNTDEKIDYEKINDVVQSRLQNLAVN